MFWIYIASLRVYYYIIALTAFVVIAAVVLLGMRIGLVVIGDFFEKLMGDRKVSEGPGLRGGVNCFDRGIQLRQGGLGVTN